MVNGCEAETPTQGETGNRKGCCGATLLKVTGDSHRGIGDSGVGFQPSAIGSWFLRLIPERLAPELPEPVAVTRHPKLCPQPIIRSPVSL
jgi:hypothetical protein